MSYFRFAPDAELAPYLDSISFQQDSRPAPAAGWPTTRVLPTGKIDLILSFGDPFLHWQGGRSSTAPGSSLVGQWTGPVDVQASGRTDLVIIGFHGWGAASFFPFPLEEINDTPVDLVDIWGAAKTARLRDRIQSAGDPARRLQIIQQWLKGERRTEADWTAVWAAHRINRHLGTLEIDDLARCGGISRRQLSRRFKAATGLTPKLFAGIVRFQKALFLLRMGRSWQDIAARCDYYDQSHLIREFRRFCGKSPGQLVAHYQPTPLLQYFNSGHHLSHFYNTVYL